MRGINKKVKSKIPYCNFFPKNCRGQFYFVAAIIIVSLAISSVAIVNYSKQEKSVEVEDIKEELKIETQKILDYDETHSEQIRNFGQTYSEYRSVAEIYFIIGEDPNIKAYEYSNGVETEQEDPQIEGDKIIFTLDESEYEFDLVSGKNFYFIVSQKLKGETHIATG